MTDNDHNRRTGIRRYRVPAERNCSLKIIAFKNFRLADHVARIVDVNSDGLGIEVEHCLEPGIIYFTESVYGKKYGILVWCKQETSRYRAGIQFISLTKAEEECLQLQIMQPRPGNALHDPEPVIAKMMDTITEEPGRDLTRRNFHPSPDKNASRRMDFMRMLTNLVQRESREHQHKLS
jgi:hypothetical protein